VVRVAYDKGIDYVAFTDNVPSATMQQVLRLFWVSFTDSAWVESTWFERNGYYLFCLSLVLEDVFSNRSLLPTQGNKVRLFRSLGLLVTLIGHVNFLLRLTLLDDSGFSR